jgi:branched-chain amino acid transport system ATP-binding protein
MEVLEFLTIEHLRNEYARALSGGQQKLLELGRLLMLDPDIIILDEPFAGVHPKLMEIIYQYIYKMNEDGKAVIIISHDMDTIFTLSKRLLVLNYGDLIADGDPEIVKRDPTVIEAYLGQDEEILETAVEALMEEVQKE